MLVKIDSSQLHVAYSLKRALHRRRAHASEVFELRPQLQIVAERVARHLTHWLPAPGYPSLLAKVLHRSLDAWQQAPRDIDDIEPARAFLNALIQTSPEVLAWRVMGHSDNTSHRWDPLAESMHDWLVKRKIRELEITENRNPIQLPDEWVLAGRYLSSGETAILATRAKKETVN